MKHSSLLYTVIAVMKKIQLLLAVAVLLGCGAYAQEKPTEVSAAADSNSAPYKKYPALPAFNILMMDSTTIFNTFNIPKGRKIAIVMFSPDCGHCKRLTNCITAGMDSLANLDFYFVTPYSRMADIKKFYRLHNLEEYGNVKMVGRDIEFFTSPFYRLSMVPAIAIYDDQKKLVGLLQGEAPLSAIYQLANQ